MDDKPWLLRVVIPLRFRCFVALFGQKTPGFPGLSSQSISGFFGPCRPENTETDWDDKPGLPKVVIPVRFGDFGLFRRENPETDWDNKPGLPRVVIPIRFWVFGPFQDEKTPRKRTGMTNLGLSSQSISRFLGPFSARKPSNALK